MPISNQNPLLGTYSNNVNRGTSSNVSPQEWEFVQQLRQTGYNPNQVVNNQQMVNQSDPYTDFEIEFSKCSNVVQNKILNDPEFKQSMFECDRIVQAALERAIRPQVMQTNEGRIAFEKLLATFRNIKDGYAKEEAANMEKLQILMQDDVVRKRLAELESASTKEVSVNNG